MRLRTVDAAKTKRPQTLRTLQTVKKVFLTAWWSGESLSRHCHPLQISLEAYASGREICKVEIFSSGKYDFLRKNLSVVAVHAADHDFYFFLH